VAGIFDSAVNCHALIYGMLDWITYRNIVKLRHYQRHNRVLQHLVPGHDLCSQNRRFRSTGALTSRVNRPNRYETQTSSSAPPKKEARPRRVSAPVKCLGRRWHMGGDQQTERGNLPSLIMIKYRFGSCTVSYSGSGNLGSESPNGRTPRGMRPPAPTPNLATVFFVVEAGTEWLGQREIHTRFLDRRAIQVNQPQKSLTC